MRALGVCGGNGIILFPFKKWLIGNVEPRSLFKTPNNEQWKANFGGIPLYTGNTLPTYDIGVDLIIGAPDCGDSSILSYSRRKALGDPKNNLSLNLYWEAIKKYQPKVWIMENLPALLKAIPINQIKRTFPNYQIICHQKSVSVRGNSQINRERLILIGILDEEKDSDELYENLRKIKKVRTLKPAGLLSKGLVYGENAHVREDENEVITLYAGYKLKINEIRKEWQTTRKDKKRWEVTGKNFTTAPGVYRNTLIDFPATARKANRQFYPKGEMMSPRELARIQGVPDRFIIIMDKTRLNFYINKGRTTVTKTPPMEIPRWVKLQLKKSKFI